MLLEPLARASLLEALLPPDVVEKITTCDSSGVGYSPLLLLVSRLAAKIDPILKKGDYAKFDAAVGDFGCELRGLIVYKVVQKPEIGEEAKKLETTFRSFSQVVNERNTKISSKGATSQPSLRKFCEEKLSITVSAEMVYLLRAHLLAEVRMVDNTQYGEKTNPALLEKIAKKIHALDRKKIVDHLQATLSKTSLDYLVREVSGLQSESLNGMLTDPARQLTKPMQPYTPKTVGATFAKIKGVLACAKRDRAILALKTELGVIIYRSPETGKKLAVSSLEDVKALSEKQPILVVEAQSKGTLQDMMVANLAQVLRLEAATCGQYASLIPLEGNQDLEAFPCLQIKKRVLALREAVSRNEIKTPLPFTLRHIYVDSLKNLIEGVKNEPAT